MAVTVQISSTLKRSLSWQSTGVAGQALSQFLVMAVLARLLEPSDFGLMAAAQVFITFAQLICEGGFGAALVHKQGLTNSFVGAILVLAMAVGMALFICLWIFADQIARLAGIPDLAQILPPLGLVFVFFSLSKIPESLLQRDMRFAALAKLTLLAQIAGYAVPAIVLAWAGYGVWALVIASIMQMVLRAALFFSGMGGRVSLKLSRAEIAEAVHYGAGLTQARFWNFIQLQGDRFVIGRQLGSASLGSYSLASQLAVLPSRYLGDVVETVLFPILARRQDDGQKLWDTYVAAAGLSTIATVAISGFLISNAENVIGIVFGDKWLNMAPLFMVLCMALPLRVISRLGDAVNRALAQLQPAANRKLVVAGVMLPAIWWAAPYGLASIAWVLLGVQILSLVLTTHLAWKGVRNQGADSFQRVNALGSAAYLVLVFLLNAAMHLIFESSRLGEISVLLMAAIGNLGICVLVAYKFMQQPVAMALSES